MTSDKPLVLIAGSSGLTGKSIVKGILESENFRLAALIRPSSADKPETQVLRDYGVEIRLGDILDGMEQLKAALSGVDILISAVPGWLIANQKDLFLAAKEAGVKRVVPCDWGTPGAKGIRDMHDTKLAIRAFIQELGIEHTFIDVGWWMQGWLPLPSRAAVADDVKRMTYVALEDGHARGLVTDRRRIGTYVARIVADPRTLNRAVMIWEDEASQAEAQELAVRFSGEGETLREKFASVPRDAFQKAIEEGRWEALANPGALGPLVKISLNGYLHSMLVLGENTLENVSTLGYLDTRALYPDIPRHTLEEFAEEFYSLPEPGEEFNAYMPSN